MSRLGLAIVLACSLVGFAGCGGGGPAGTEIVRVSRQNSSGTYQYFLETVVGKDGEYKMGASRLNGSKEVVDLIENTPAAIGYSGMGYATDHVKMLAISKGGGAAVKPTAATASDGSYPIARGLNVYVIGEAEGAAKHYLDWCMSSEGQAIVETLGYVPAPTGGGAPPEGPPPEASIKISGSDTLVNLAQAWAEAYMGKYKKDDGTPIVNLEVSGGGSGVGLKGLQDGTVQMANASRDIKESEREKIMAEYGKDVTEYVVALDALAVYVHPSNPIDEISMADLKQIYGEGGTIDAWEQVTGYPATADSSAAH